MLAVQPAENAHRRNTHEPDLGNASVGTGYIHSALGGLPAKRFFDCIRTQGIPTNIERMGFEMSKTTTRTNILRLVESGVMIALATVLSTIKFIDMPMGGSVTAFSMLPIMLIAYRYGVKWGTLTGVTYGLLQMLLGMQNLRYGASVWAVLVIILFDYLVAFGVLGTAGAFRKTLPNQTAALAVGSVVASVLRFACHFISGWVVWAVWAPEGMPAWRYSLEYNGYYMLPECILTTVAAVLLSAYLDFSSTDITRRAAKTAQTVRNPIASGCKLAGGSVMVAGVLYVVSQAISALTVADFEPDKIHLITIVVGTLVAGILIIALGEVVQLLTDLRDERRNASK